MIIIPEIKTVVLQPPRTGTTSVRNAVLEKYPKAFPLYRHMEFCGIPKGYESWRTVCQIRDPLERLLSLFTYMKNPIVKATTDLEWLEKVKIEAANGFDAWLDRNFIFANPSSPAHDAFRPYYTVNWAIPEQRKSQELYRSETTSFIKHEFIVHDAKVQLDIDIDHTNQSLPEPVQYDLERTLNWLLEWHSWDCCIYGIETISSITSRKP